jgi:F-type H+-transporting ATPase subunit b
MAETTNTRSEVAAEEKAFPPFQPENFASQLFWLVIAFVILYALMAKLALPRIGGILAARHDRIAEDLAEAERSREQADAALAAYEKQLAEARNRAQAVANETRDRLNAAAEKSRRGLEDKLNAKLAEADKTIAATKTAAMMNVRGIATEAASAIVQRLTGTQPAGAAVERAVADALKR